MRDLKKGNYRINSILGKIEVICLVAVLTFAMAGCSMSDGEALIDEEFRGGWECEETTLEDPESYTGYLHLEVSDDGSYSMYDISAGNPGIEGWLEVLSDTELILHIKKTVDTDIPVEWEGISYDQEMKYCFTDDGKLQISYDDGKQTSTLVFYRLD
ncbi:MAG: hypothetical protein ACI4LP_08045 [Anaerovoracaceae bacterium]